MSYFIILICEDNRVAYSTVEAAFALGTTPKLLDNLLAREAKHLIVSGRQGRSRKIDEQVLEVLAVALLIRRDLSVPVGKSIDLASVIVTSGSFQASVGGLAVLRFDLAALRQVLKQALSDAVADQSPIRRGRPPAKAKRGASL